MSSEDDVGTVEFDVAMVAVKRSGRKGWER
jgi:hypothetical protein